MTMRSVAALLLAVVAMLGSVVTMPAVPASAEGILYDDFSDRELDSAKWIGFQVAPGSFSGSPLELTRKIRGGRGELAGKLELSHRMVGGPVPSSGQESRNRMLLRGIPLVPGPVGVVANFVGVEFDVMPIGFTTEACPTPTPVPTRVRAGFNNQMFNDPGIPYTGGNTGNIGALVELRRNSTFLDPPDTIRALGFVYRCQNADCTQTVSVSVDLGPVRRREETRLKLRWQPELDGVSFQKGDEAPMFIAYTNAPLNVDPALDEFSNPPKPTGFSFRALDVVTLAPSCAERSTVAEITALFDNIVVLPLVP